MLWHECNPGSKQLCECFMICILVLAGSAAVWVRLELSCFRVEVFSALKLLHSWWLFLSCRDKDNCSGAEANCTNLWAEISGCESGIYGQWILSRQELLGGSCETSEDVAEIPTNPSADSETPGEVWPWISQTRANRSMCRSWTWWSFWSLPAWISMILWKGLGAFPEHSHPLSLLVPP